MHLAFSIFRMEYKSKISVRGVAPELATGVSNKCCLHKMDGC